MLIQVDILFKHENYSKVDRPERCSTLGMPIILIHPSDSVPEQE